MCIMDLCNLISFKMEMVRSLEVRWYHTILDKHEVLQEWSADGLVYLLPRKKLIQETIC